MAVLLASCTPGGGREVHGEGGGPLSSRSDGVSVSVFAPKTTPWDVAFGGRQLCATDGSTIEIEKFRLKTEVKALSTELRLRTLVPSDFPSGWEESEEVDSYTRRVSSVGKLPDTEDGPLVGTFTKAKPGLKVSQRCDEVKEVDKGYSELLVQFNVGKRGAYMKNMWIDYRADGKPYTLDLGWGAIACGNAIPLVDGQDLCDDSVGD